MQLAHSGDDHLPCFLVGFHHEGRVLIGETLESDRHLFLVHFGLWFDGHGDHGIREGRRLEEHFGVLVAEGVTGADFLETHDRGDVAGVAGVDIRVLVRLNLDQTAHALPFTGAGVVNLVAFGNLAAIDAEEDQLADEFVGPELESEGAKLAVVVRGGGDFGFLVVRVDPDLSVDVHRSRQVVGHGVEQSLDTFVLKGGPTGDRDDQVGDHRAAQRFLHVFHRDGLLFEEHHAEFFIDVAKGGGEIIVSGVGDETLVFREVDRLVGRAELVVVRIDNGFLGNHVDHALELIFGTDRDQDRMGVGSEFSAEVTNDVVEVRSGAVHLIDERHPGNVILGRLAPDRFGLRLHTGHAAIHEDHTVENAQGALHLGRKVHVAGSVDDIHPQVLAFEHLVDAFGRELLPPCGHGGGGNRDPALFLLLHPVRRGRPVMNFTDPVNHAGVEQDTLGQRGLSGIDVRGNPNVARALQHILPVGAVQILGHQRWLVGRGRRNRITKDYQRK